MVVSSHKPKPKNVGFFTQTKTQKCLSLRTSQNPNFAQAKTQKRWFLRTSQNPKMLVSSHNPKAKNVGQ
jgi:hypothetical protein